MYLKKLLFLIIVVVFSCCNNIKNKHKTQEKPEALFVEKQVIKAPYYNEGDYFANSVTSNSRTLAVLKGTGIYDGGEEVIIFFYEKGSNGTHRWILKDSISNDLGVNQKLHIKSERIFTSNYLYKEKGNTVKDSNTGVIITYLKNDRNKWVKEQTILPPSIDYNHFGKSIVFHDSIIYVLALQYDLQYQTDKFNMVFKYLKGNNGWVINDSLDVGEYSGISDELEQQNNYLANGCIDCRSVERLSWGKRFSGGKVDVYEKSLDESWIYKKSLGFKQTKSKDQFGTDVSIYANQIAVGNPNRSLQYDTLPTRNLSYSEYKEVGSVCIYNLYDTSRFPIQEIFAPDFGKQIKRHFGSKVILAKKYLFIGLSSSLDYDKSIDRDKDSLDSRGAIYVYKKQYNRWVFSQKIQPKSLHEIEQFGRSFNFNEELNELTIGSNINFHNYYVDFSDNYVEKGEMFDVGKVYVFRLDTINEN